jgi:hypothetical protein
VIVDGQRFGLIPGPQKRRPGPGHVCNLPWTWFKPDRTLYRCKRCRKVWELWTHPVGDRSWTEVPISNWTEAGGME